MTANAARSLEQATQPSPSVRQLTVGHGVRVWLLRVLLVALGLGAWQWVSSSGLVNILFTSSPQNVALKLLAWLVDGTIAANLRVTVYEAMVGWLLASFVGVTLGYAVASWKLLDDATSPFVDAFNASPRLALASLFIVWFGIGAASKIAIVFSVVVVILYVATNSAAKSVDPDLVLVVRVMGANRWQMIEKVALPWCVPFIFSALRLAMAYAFTGAVVGEMIVSQAGLGNLIAAGAGTLDTSGVLAAVLIVVIVAYVASSLLITLETRLLRWRPASL